MLEGMLVLTNFNVGLLEGKTPDKKPIKILAFKDGNSNLEIRAVFTPEQYEGMVQAMSATKIIPAHRLPPKLILPK